MHLANDKLISAKADPGMARVKRAFGASGRSQNQSVVRFWIVTVLPVLSGLFTLESR